MNKMHPQFEYVTVNNRDRVMRRIYAERGLATRIAIRLGLTNQAIQQWKRVPPEHVMSIAAILDMRPEDIRPDIFKPRKLR
jgi:DNA-binding transcriptional regulator YdaS (Cro superfamily)